MITDSRPPEPCAVVWRECSDQPVARSPEYNGQSRIRAQRRSPAAAPCRLNDENSRAKLQNVKEDSPVVGHDSIGPADAVEGMDRQLAGGAWTYGVLHDARQITWIPTKSEVRRLVSHVETISRTHGPTGPVAFITANEALFGMMRMYSLLGQEVALIEVYRDLVHAEQWLDEQIQRQV